MEQPFFEYDRYIEIHVTTIFIKCNVEDKFFEIKEEQIISKEVFEICRKK